MTRIRVCLHCGKAYEINGSIDQDLCNACDTDRRTSFVTRAELMQEALHRQSLKQDDDIDE